MMYSVFIQRSAAKAIEHISNPFKDKIINAIHKLANDPRPSGCKKLSGREAWRIRIGDYRVIYEINDKSLIVLVVNAGHRKNIYQ